MAHTMTTPTTTTAPVRTIMREYTNAQIRDADMARMAEYDWSVQSVQTIAGGYAGGKGCLLALLFLPLALLAGSKPDRYIVTYATTQPVGQALLPDQVWT